MREEDRTGAESTLLSKASWQHNPGNLPEKRLDETVGAEGVRGCQPKADLENH